jgi:SAM-dependent methyltransferase
MERSYRPREVSNPLDLAQANESRSIDSAGIRSALSALYGSYQLVGQLPPEPPTFRGRLSARLVKLVQRMLFWYTPQIVHFQYSALRAFEEQTKSIESVAAHLQSFKRSEDAARQSLELRIRQLESEQAEERAQSGEPHRAGEDRNAGAHTHHGVEAMVIAQERRIFLLLEEARQRRPESLDAAQLQRLYEEHRRHMDAFYAALEDEFRGSRADIKERLGVYLPKLAEAGIGSPAMPILDVGCGRGEWLEVLRERNWKVSGVDSNPAMVAACQERGLPAMEAEAIAYLRALPESSLGAVTAFHFIEHLPLQRLLDFLDATARALKPGGVAIFETPNPNNVFVSSRYFYLDSTHHHSIPPLLGQFLAEARGLRHVEILELRPWPRANRMDTRTGGDLAMRFNKFFYAPQDYAIIGRKPNPANTGLLPKATP